MNQLVLEEVLEELFDYRGKTPRKLGFDFEAEGVPVVSAVLVNGGGLDLENARHVSLETYEAWMSKKLQKGDVLLTSEAPLGRVARVPSDAPLVLGQRLFGLRGKPNVLDNGYLFYALQTDGVQSDLVGRSTGTTVFGIRQSALRKVRIPEHPYVEQRAIAEVLGALDDKIAANSRHADSVDRLLATRFSHLLSGRYVNSSVGAVADVNASSVAPLATGELRYVDIAAVSVGRFEYPQAIKWVDAPSRARRQLSKGDTIWSTVRPNRRSHALVLSQDELLVGSTGLAVLSPRDVGFAYLYEATKRAEFTSYLEQVAEGSAYPAVRAQRFTEAPIPLLHDQARDGFELLAAPMREHVHSLAEETRTLARLRDTLLPLLMSGKLRVRDAEKSIEEVLY